MSCFICSNNIWVELKKITLSSTLLYLCMKIQFILAIIIVNVFFSFLCVVFYPKIIYDKQALKLCWEQDRSGQFRKGWVRSRKVRTGCVEKVEAVGAVTTTTTRKQPHNNLVLTFSLLEIIKTLKAFITLFPWFNLCSYAQILCLLYTVSKTIPKSFFSPVSIFLPSHF